MNSSQSATGGTFQVLTSRGPAAIAVVCLRGELAHTFLSAHVRAPRRGASNTWPDRAVFRAALLDEDGAAIDDILVSVHATEPALDVRLHLHGSPWIVGKCTELLHDADLIEEREQTSALWKSNNEIEAEAHAILPEMLTLRGVEWLAGQPELLTATLREVSQMRDIESAKQTVSGIIERRNIVDRFRRPFRIALVGPPNAGKSTLANALADRQVSVVSPVPGTTRDWVESLGEVAGFPVAWWDTAGIREGGCELETEGVQRSLRIAKTADALLLVLDGSAPETWPDAFDSLGRAPECVALNKIDLAPAGGDCIEALPERWRRIAATISAKTHSGLDGLVARIREIVAIDEQDLGRPSAFSENLAGQLTAALSCDRDSFSQALTVIADPKYQTS